MRLVEFCNLVLPREVEEACSQNQQFNSQAHPLPELPNGCATAPERALTGSRGAHMNLLSPLVKHKPLGQGHSLFNAVDCTNIIYHFPCVL